MRLQLLSLLALTSTTLALPQPWWFRPFHGTGGSLASVELPLSTLPLPGTRVLKFALLGVGTQNYTCANSTAQATPVAVGAVADLYDIGTELSNDPFSVPKLLVIPVLAYNFNHVNKDALQVYLKSEGYQNQLGKHFFNAAGTPIFSLDSVHTDPFPHFDGKKTANIPAPTDAFKGAQQEGAVDWLLLDNFGTSVGLDAAYRVVTAGGKPPATCAGVGPKIEVPYAAEYFFYSKP